MSYKDVQSRRMGAPMGRRMGGPMGFAMVGGGLTLALDNINSAVLAFSISRKLRTAYTGSAIRVRRSSDDTDQDIGFVGNALDTASLESFCGAGNGFITKVYEQSGHAAAVDYAQTTAANQPQIVDSGTTITKDGKVAMRQPTRVPGSDEFVSLATWGTRPSDCILIDVWSAQTADAVVSASGASAVFALVAQDGSSSTSVSADSGSGLSYYADGGLIGNLGTVTRDQMHTALVTDSLHLSRISGVSLSDAAYSNMRTSYAGSTIFVGPEYWSEQIIITDTAEVAALESNIADRYGITLSA